MALFLRLKTTRPKSHSLTNSPLHRLFSTTGGDDGNKRQPTSNSSQNESVSDANNKINNIQNRTTAPKQFTFQEMYNKMQKERLFKSLSNTNQGPAPKRRPSSKNLSYARSYMHDELGEKLKKLRPEVKGKDWFSIAELSERLKKVREMDEIEASSNTNDGTNQMFSHLRHALGHIKSKESR